MAKKSKLKKVLITIVTVLVSLVLAIGLAGLAVYNFVIIPKYNQYINSGEKQGDKLTNKDIVTFAKYLTNKDFLESITNVTEDTAKDVLSALIEIEDETETSDETETQGESGKDKDSSSATNATPFINLAPEKTDIAFTQANTQKLYSPTKAQQSPAQIDSQQGTPNEQTNANQDDTTAQPTAAPDKSVLISKSDVPAKKQSAYDRIMAAASKEEIQTGMAIIAKVNMGKVNSLQAAGKTSELKAYIKSVLSSGEISTALKLYKKYKHLL